MSIQPVFRLLVCLPVYWMAHCCPESGGCWFAHPFHLPPPKDHGIFVSRVDMGSAAETMGLKVGHEVIMVNDIEVGERDVQCKRNSLTCLSPT